ncbi:MAG: hypothetical protein L0H73_04895 [Nitrococcus sp.]|nr:hypothetical protein [Nitrococcus sp.]
MRINARLDEDRSRKFGYLQQISGAGVSEIVKLAIDAYYDRMKRTCGDAAALLSKSGFVGCGCGPAGLSQDYKEELARAMGTKHGDR